MLLAFAIIAVYGIFSWLVLTVLGISCIVFCVVEISSVLYCLKIHREWAERIFEQRRRRHAYVAHFGRRPPKYTFLMSAEDLAELRKMK